MDIMDLKEALNVTEQVSKYINTIKIGYPLTLTAGLECINIFKEKEPKGEIVFMVAPPSETTAEDIDLDSLIRKKLQSLPLKTAVKELVNEYKLNKNDVYARALEIKNEND